MLFPFFFLRNFQLKPGGLGYDHGCVTLIMTETGVNCYRAIILLFRNTHDTCITYNNPATL